MEKRLCEYCGKKISSRRRADARYCPTSRCRVGGYRKRVQSGTYSTTTYVPYRQRGRNRGEQVIARWQEQGVEVVQDAWCQARAERLAYEIMERRCAERRQEAWAREWKESSPFGREEMILAPRERIQLSNKVRCVGLAVIPAECGGGAVLVTGIEQDSRYRRR